MVTAVKRMYNWAAKQGILSEDQLRGVEHVSRHVNAPAHPEPKHMDLDHALHCIQLCRTSPPLGDLSEMLLLTGMRVGELIRVPWQGVDFAQKRLVLEQHNTSGRNNARPRMIPLCQRAMDIGQEQARDDLGATQPVFLGANGQPFTVGALHLRLRRLRGKHPELKGFSFHRLRHTYVTYLARLKVPERVARAVLGHSSTLMIRYCTATGPDEMIEAVERPSARMR